MSEAKSAPPGSVSGEERGNKPNWRQYQKDMEALRRTVADQEEELKWMTDRILSARFLPEGSCGFFWRTDYGPAYCDQGKDHQGSHRCWGSQGAMTFAQESPDV